MVSSPWGLCNKKIAGLPALAVRNKWQKKGRNEKKGWIFLLGPSDKPASQITCVAYLSYAGLSQQKASMMMCVTDPQSQQRMKPCLLLPTAAFNTLNHLKRLLWRSNVLLYLRYWLLGRVEHGTLGCPLMCFTLFKIPIHSITEG